MKKYLFPILSVILVVGMATIVWATVMGTYHEIASEPCAVCHTPHSGSGDYPLWNRTQAPQTWTVYDSISFDMGPANNPPRSPSSLCLVCHNGVFSSLVNYPGPCSTTDADYDVEIAGCNDLETNLMDDHPISFDYYPNYDVDGNNFPPAVNISLSPTRTRYVIPGTTADYFLYAESAATASANGWFECATCHSVHDLATYPGKGDYQVYFLRSDNTRSQLCLDCHTAR